MQIRKLAAIVCLVVIIAFTMTACSNKVNNNSTKIQDENPDNDRTENQSEIENLEISIDKTNLEKSTTQQSESSFEPIERIQLIDFISEHEIQKKINNQLKQKTVKSVYARKYQSAADQVIDKYKNKNSYTFESPLLIQNPYGTTKNGVYLFYTAEESCGLEYTIYVDNEAIVPFHAKMKNLSAQIQEELMVNTDQEGMLIGLILGVKNYITLTEVNDAGEVLRTQVLCLDLSESEPTEDVLYMKEIDSTLAEATDGLYTFMNAANSKNTGIRMVDTSGVLRFRIDTEKKVNADLVMTEQSFVFPMNKSQIAKVNSLGKVTQLISLGRYRYESGLTMSEDQSKIYFIASDTKRETIRDLVLCYDFTEEKLQTFIDFTVEFQELHDGDVKNWIDLDSIAILSSNELLVNSTKLASVMCFSFSEDNIMMKYVISENDVWEKIGNEYLRYTSIGSFTPFSGQTQIDVIQDDNSIVDGQYYILMMNCDYTESASAVYKIFVDQNTETFTLADRIELSSVFQNGSVQEYSQNTIVYTENDSDGAYVREYEEDNKLVRELVWNEKMKYHQVKKMDYQGIWWAQ